MASNAQIEFLESMYGLEGDAYLLIINFPNLTLGTKVLYLQRAISLSEDKFLLCLDKLNSSVSTMEKLNLIIFLKALNDLCFNHEIFYERQAKKALTHYFSRLGDNPNPDEFKIIIKRMIKNQISALMMENPQQCRNIHSEKASRRIQESLLIYPDSTWRRLVSFLPPKNQNQTAYNDGNIYSFFIHSSRLPSTAANSTITLRQNERQLQVVIIPFVGGMT